MDVCVEFEVCTEGNAKVFVCPCGWDVGAMEGVGELDRVFLTVKLKGFTFVRAEGHLPFGLPLLEGVKVSLEEFAVVARLDRSIDETVISK